MVDRPYHLLNPTHNQAQGVCLKRHDPYLPLNLIVGRLSTEPSETTVLTSSAGNQKKNIRHLES